MLKFAIFVYMSNENYDKANHCQAIWCMPVNRTKLTVILSEFFFGKAEIIMLVKSTDFFSRVFEFTIVVKCLFNRNFIHIIWFWGQILSSKILFMFLTLFFSFWVWVFGLFHNLVFWLGINCDRFGKRHFKYLQMTRYFSVKILLDPAIKVLDCVQKQIEASANGTLKCKPFEKCAAKKCNEAL